VPALMNTWGKAIVDFYFSAWWQLYVAASAGGFSSALIVAVRNRDFLPLGWYASLIRFLLYFAAISVLTTVGLTLAHYYQSPWVTVCFVCDHLVGFFVDGAVMAALVTSLGIVKATFLNKDSWSSIFLHPQTVLAARFSVAGLYVAAGLLKFLAHETLNFFHDSGYSTAFFFFIATWELLWGLAVLWHPAAILGLIALSIDMFGAIYTHYHNYFTRGFPGPLGNSLDAFRMLFLIAYIAFALTRAETHSVQTSTSVGTFRS